MSPEQCEGKIEIDHRADIYSLGVLLFEMLTGKVPFGGDGYGEIIVKHVTMPPPSVRSIVPGAARRAGSDPVPRAGEGPRSALPDDGGVRGGAAATRERYAQLGARHRHPRRPVGRGARGGADGAFGDGRRASKIGFGSGLDIGTAAGRHPVDVPRGAWRAHRAPDPQGRSGGILFFYVGVAGAGRGGRRHCSGSRGGGSKQPLPDDARRAAPERGAHQLQLRSGRRDRLRGDGKTLGLTPLSIEVPYSDSAVEFQFRKAGFEKKTVYVVPEPAVAAVRDAAQDRERRRPKPPPSRRADDRQSQPSRRKRRARPSQLGSAIAVSSPNDSRRKPTADEASRSDQRLGLKTARSNAVVRQTVAGHAARRRRSCGRWLSLRTGARRRA